MKRILITGKDSYVGVSFENWLKNYNAEYVIDTIDMQEEKWRECDFSLYDTVFQVAGIAHADVGKVSDEQKQLYYKVNCDLAVETAKLAKEQGIKQFIYMSSMIVYGDGAGMQNEKIITKDTATEPAGFYGDSKLRAEKELVKLEDVDFNVVIIRAPMIYGKGSKGNYPLLAKFAKKIGVIPRVYNQRSMIYIYNLCEFIRKMIDNDEKGIFFPQNEEYVSTCELVQQIGKVYGKKIRVLGILNPLVFLAGKLPGRFAKLANKAFGNLVYEKEMSIYKDKYCVVSFSDSIVETER